MASLWLVNARETRNLPGRKSDVQESQWLLKLHTYGITEEVVPAGSGNTGHTKLLAGTGRIRAAGRCMRATNAKGADGDERAVNDGAERSERIDWHEDHPGDCGRRAGWEEVGRVSGSQRQGQQGGDRQQPGRHMVAGAVGDRWAATGRLDHVQQQMAACDKDLAAMLKGMPTTEVKPVEAAAPALAKTGRRQRKKASKNQPNFDIAGELKRIAGVDLTRIDGIQAMTSPDPDQRGRAG